MIKKILFTIALIPSFAVNAKSPIVFLQENPRAAHTLKTPEKISLCMAVNGILLESTEVTGSDKAKLNKLNAIIWAFIEEEGIADEVENLLPSSVSKIENSKSNGHLIGRLMDSAGCENLNESIIKTYIKY